jgi:hypothetical protein
MMADILNYTYFITVGVRKKRHFIVRSDDSFKNALKDVKKWNPKVNTKNCSYKRFKGIIRCIELDGFDNLGPFQVDSTEP